MNKDDYYSQYFEICKNVLAFAEAENYSGYSKFDALNSPILKVICRDNRYLGGGVTLVVNKSPVNVRRVLLVKKSRNPKGIALFIRAYLNLYQLTQRDEYLKKAELCLEWLRQNAIPGYSGPCWGYNFDWVSRLFYAPKGTPNCVVTVFVCEALIHAYEVTNNEKYLIQAEQSALFLMKDLPILYEDNSMKCVGYVPIGVNNRVININALLGSLLAKLWRYSNNDLYLIEGSKLISYVTGQKTMDNCWYYTDPPSASSITYDNYHTGGILDSLLEFMEYTNKKSYQKIWEESIHFYVNNLFLPDGSPKWMADKTYPLNIHGSAQGIVTFSKASKYNDGCMNIAKTIANWSVENLYDRKWHYFYYQKNRFFTERYTLMRWCNGWMTRAISELLLKMQNINGDW